MKFSDIHTGDTITLTRVENPNSVRSTTFTVDRSYETDVTGPILTDGPDQFFYELNGWAVTLNSTANGIPTDAAAIMWSDYDHDDHIAFSTGHPANKCWSYNGVTMSEANLVQTIAGFPVTALDFRV